MKNMIWSKAYENEVQDRNTTNQGDSPMNTIKTSKEINHKYSNQKKCYRQAKLTPRVGGMARPAALMAA
jgi:hypothetical protein